ncbi:MAG TPA: glucose/sorbosone family PQQ-dependent dehydrogenase [Nitrososphaera sp.]|nr:glucose/sorbosone family PQQ-dependent dehydrogenase [Nitrososphaera sp.]
MASLLTVSLTLTNIAQSAMAQTNMTSLSSSSTTPLSFNQTGAQNASATAAVDDSGLPIQQGFKASVLATNFSAPHNILYGPDGALWITERVGQKITRIDPNTGENLSSMPVPDVYQTGGQDGVMGMAFDPDFNSTSYIYVAYTYDGKPSTSNNSTATAGDNTSLGNPENNNTNAADDQWRRTKITRFTYDPDGQSLGQPVDLISGLSGSGDHNSGRMVFGPDGMLYYTIGDQGNNQFDNYCKPIRAQWLPTDAEVQAENWTTYEGKVLRMNPDGSIPEDNPVINGVKSHIFTYGHRNAQGISVGPGGVLYSVEHGDKSDDEFNRLEAGGNYGWPNVAGFNDGKAYQYANWSSAENCPELTFSNMPPFPPSVSVMNESEFVAPDFMAPIQTFYTVEDDYNFTSPPDCGYVCWPTVAPSSLRLYSSDAIPDWNGTFLMTTLKGGGIFHLTLNDNGTALSSDPAEMFRSENRYRDLTFGPDGKTIYVITDSSGPVQAIEGGPIATVKNPGSLLVFTYEGTHRTSDPSTP